MIDNENQYPSFDLSYLNQVFQGNKEMIHQIIIMFVKQVPDYFNEMQECVVRADFSALHPLAHKAKSSIAMLGLKDMEALVLEIEKKSKNVFFDIDYKDSFTFVHVAEQEAKVDYRFKKTFTGFSCKNGKKRKASAIFFA